MARTRQHIANPPLMTSAASAELLLKGVKSVITDDGFSVPMPQAIAAREIASSVLTWCEQPGKDLNTFAGGLVSDLSVCFNSHLIHKPQVWREHMWHHYHRVRTTEAFRTKWSEFVKMTTNSQQSCPAFSQFVTDVIFKELILKHSPVESHTVSSASTPITSEEANAVRYAAGYTLRSLRKKIEASSYPLKEELVLALVLLIGDEDEPLEESSEWINSIDRGGLWHVSNQTCLLFYAIEEELRQHLKVSAVKELSDGFKEGIKSDIVSNDNVQHYWSVLCTEAEEEEKEVLLAMIVDLWITIRGFSFARSWMEMFKQASKKCTQRAKALRRDIQ